MNTHQKHSFALSFSGGGLSCIAYAGFYDFLKAHSLQPAAIGGLSGGAILAVLLASGLSVEEIKECIRHINSVSLINTHVSTIEILDHRKLIQFFREFLPIKMFEDLPIPVCVFTSDLEKRQSNCIHEGDIASAIVASCSVFPLLQPVKRRGLLLGDGGFTTYYGAQYLRNSHVEKVIGIDVTGTIEGKVKGIFSGLYRQINASVTSVARYELMINPVDLDIRIDFPSPTPLNFNQNADHLIELGRKTAEKKLHSIKSILK